MSSRAERRPEDHEAPDAGLRDEAHELGGQYDQAYFEQYGRGPHQYEVGVPYRFGEPLWESYFAHIADLIVSELSPRTVLDAGCAIGFLVKALRDRGVEGWGIDISEYAIEHTHESVRQFCSVGSVTDDLGRDYDLIVSTEVLEHIPEHLAPAVLSNFARHTNAILFSASPDGFRDPTHLNVQQTDYWVELFAREGFFRNLEVDASVVAPQAIHFLRAGQTAVSVARAYERWHWRMLTELRELREARRLVADEFLRVEQTRARLEGSEAEIASLLEQLDDRKGELEAALERMEQHEAAAERADSELDALLDQLEYQKAAAYQAELELRLLRQTRTFRYTAPARRVYGQVRLSRRGRRLRRGDAPSAVRSQTGAQPGIRYGIDAPMEGQLVANDLIVPVQGWAIFDRGLVARVELSVDGAVCGRARLGLPRPDVAARFDRADASVSGFEALLELEAVAVDAKSAVVEVCVESTEGERHRLPPVAVRLPPTGRRDRATLSARPTRRTAPATGLRLLAFTHHLGLGGGQLYLFELLRLLSRLSDFGATVVAPEDGPLRRQTRALGLDVVIGGHHPLRSIELYEARMAEMDRWARDAGFNAVLANTIGSFPGVDLAARLSLPAVWAIHESFSLSAFWRVAYGPPGAVHPLVQARAEAAFASAGAIVFEADATRELFLHHGEPDRFVTVPYGIDIQEIDRYLASVSREEARRQLKLPADADVLLCLGTIEPRKGQAALAEAFGAVAKEHTRACLVLVGARADESSTALERFIHDSDLEDRIRIVPVTPDIYLWYRAVDAFVCASDIESLPRTVLEAMAFSIPVIATRVFGLPELIEDGTTGYLSEPLDVRAMEQTLRRFLRSSQDERAAVGVAGSSLVRERHDSSGYADAYNRILRGLIEDPRTTPGVLLARESSPNP